MVHRIGLFALYPFGPFSRFYLRTGTCRIPSLAEDTRCPTFYTQALANVPREPRENPLLQKI